MAASLSLTLGLGALAGCGGTPVQTPAAPQAATAPALAPATQVMTPNVQAEPKPAPAPVAIVAPIAAQEGDSAPAPANGGAPAPAPAAPPAEGGTPATPTTPSDTIGETPAETPPAATPPAPGIMPDTAIGGVGSVVYDTHTGVFGDEGDHGLVVFQSDRATGGGGGMDIFVFDAVAATVLALPGVNTWADETNARLSSNGDWLVYQSNENGSNDILLFSLRSQLINTLQTLNTEFADEEQADVSDDGSLIVYVSTQKHDGKFGSDELRVFDLLNGNNFRVPVANRGLVDVNWPTISGNGDVIAYGAYDGKSADIFVYSLDAAAQLTPPFLNTANGEYNPDLNAMGDLITFVSDRRGSEDIYVTDMRSGYTDNMVLANSAAIEQEPRWLAGGTDAIIFHTDRTGEFRMMAYDLTSAVLNTLPVANELFSNTLLRDPAPHL